MRLEQLKTNIISDLTRIYPKPSLKNILVALMFNASFKITFWIRIGKYLLEKNNFISKILFKIVFLIHKHNQYKTGIQVDFKTNIGLGLFFNHFSCIVIDSSAIIGDNCTIMHGTTIGSVRSKGSPTIGNNVVLSAGSKVIGKITIGNNVMIGANTVVTKDVPDNAVVVGNPSKIVNYDGIKHTDLYKNN